jgi:hypothetical protein
MLLFQVYSQIIREQVMKDNYLPLFKEDYEEFKGMLGVYLQEYADIHLPLSLANVKVNILLENTFSSLHLTNPL